MLIWGCNMTAFMRDVAWKFMYKLTAGIGEKEYSELVWSH